MLEAQPQDLRMMRKIPMMKDPARIDKRGMRDPHLLPVVQLLILHYSLLPHVDSHNVSHHQGQTALPRRRAAPANTTESALCWRDSDSLCVAFARCG